MQKATHKNPVWFFFAAIMSSSLRIVCLLVLLAAPALLCQPVPTVYDRCRPSNTTHMANSTGLCIPSTSTCDGQIMAAEPICQGENACCVMSADYKYAAAFNPSPNIVLGRSSFNDLNVTVSTVILYASGGVNASALIHRYTAANNGSFNVSTHYIVDTDGTVTQLVKESNSAFHLYTNTTTESANYWVADKINPVFFTIGIMLISESANNDEAMSDKQFAAATDLINDILKRRWSFLEINGASEWQTTLVPAQPGAGVNMSQFVSLKYIVPTITPDYSGAIVVPSHNYWPNRSDHDGNEMSITAVVLHATAMDGGAVAWFEQKASDVSSHYVVKESGLVVQCVPEKYSAWHAGVVTNNSVYYNGSNPNRWTIGIEHERNRTNSNAMPEVQILASLSLVQDILNRYGPLDMIEHDQINVGRICPGPNFPLDRFTALKSDKVMGVVSWTGLVVVGLIITILTIIISIISCYRARKNKHSDEIIGGMNHTPLLD